MERMKKELGGVSVFAIATGAMISSGLFVLPSVVYRIGGPSIILSYLVSAILVIPAMLSKAELATAMPKSGGTYFFVHRSFGPLFGTFAGFAAWFSLSLKSAFALVGLGIFLEPVIPAISGEMLKIIAVVFTLVFSVLNILSVKESGKVQIALVLGLLAILLYYIAGSFGHIDVERYVPFAPQGWRPSLIVMGMIFVSYGGLTKVASVAGEIRDPGRTIPRGMFASLIVVALFYLVCVFATVGILSPGELSETLTPLSSGASSFGGRVGSIILSVAAMLAFISTANAGLMAASRNPMAMSKDNLLPTFFSRISLRYKTPVFAILATALFMILVIIFLDLESLVKVASTMKLILFALVNVSVIVMRESRIVSYKPAFKAPLYPYLQILGTVIYLFLIFEMGTVPLIITLGFFVVSLLWYFLYSRRRNLKDSALIRVVERVTSKDIKSTGLTEELRDILMERDEIREDRFDRLIKEAEIVDLEEGMDLKGLFHRLSEIFAGKLSLSPQEIYRLLEKREEDSTTAIHAGLAIPHIVLEGEGEFDIVVARSKEGIAFHEGFPPVHIVFALAGSKGERNFHLQALMAIAQIVQNPDFSSHWFKAGSIEDLRNLILLAQRVRKGEV
jgi:amino acid transporter/mannitol/fructose-specific phosphotransferase system IIA component (Ntr-type)